MNAPRAIFRSGRPRQKREAWIFGALTALCAAGVIVRGPEPALVWGLVLLPLAGYALSAFLSREERDRIREVRLDGDALVLRSALRPPRRVPLSALSDWKLDKVEVWVDDGLKEDWPALSVREADAEPRRYFLVDGADIDLDAFRSFAPVAVADLETLHARRRGRGCDFRAITSRPPR